jgi:hypothetical protein
MVREIVFINNERERNNEIAFTKSANNKEYKNNEKKKQQFSGWFLCDSTYKIFERCDVGEIGIYLTPDKTRKSYEGSKNPRQFLFCKSRRPRFEDKSLDG